MSSFLFGLEVAVVFLVMICVLVAAHEYGHYLFARLFGMGVEEFAIGMGKKIKVWHKRVFLTPVSPDYVHDPSSLSAGASFEGGTVERTSAKVIDTPSGRMLQDETEFTIRMLPIGGFVRIKGMVPEEDGSETRIPGGFYSKAPWKRLIVLVAGPVFSVLAGMLLFMGVYMTEGVLRPINKPVLGMVSASGPNTAAANAGLKVKDEIVEIGGKPISTFYQLVEAVQAHPNEDLPVTYRRDGKVLHTVVHPTLGETGVYSPDMMITDTHQAGMLGIAPDMVRRRLALGEAVEEVSTLPAQAMQGILRLVRQPSRLKKEAGGAVSMVQMTSEATKLGPAYIIAVAAMISISVGFFNLLPIPPLDGGQMAMAIAEIVRGGKRLSIQVQSLVTSAGVIAVLLLAVFALFIDVQRVTGGDKTPDKPAATHPGR